MLLRSNHFMPQQLPTAIVDAPKVPPQYRPASSVPLRIFAACLTSVLVAVHYTNFGPLIPTLITSLHINSAQTGLFSTFLFLGLAAMYIPGGMLADLYGERPVLIGSSILLVIGATLLPLFPNLTWVLACRFIVGLGSGAAFVAGAGVAAGLGKHASLGQGMYGGSVQVGSGLGLLLTPFLLAHFGWRGSFLVWGLLGIPLIKNEPRQPKWARRNGVSNSPNPDPTCTEPPYMPCPNDACLPRPAATPAPATKAAPEPRPTMKRHASTQVRLGKSGSSVAPMTRRMDEPIKTGRSP